MIFELLKFQIADVKGNIGDAEILGRPHVTDDRYLADLQQEYRDTHAKFTAIYMDLAEKIRHLSGKRNMNIACAMAKSASNDLDEQCEQLEEYLQSICPHDKVRHYTTGSVHMILGEAWDDIEDHAECEFCGKEVIYGDNTQDGTWAEF